MPSLYLETSIISYATSELSREPHILVRQEDAKTWWDKYSTRFELFVSQVVLDEIARGDAVAAKKRLQLVSGLPIIPITDSVLTVARELLNRSLLPETATADALHVALAVVAEVEYLLTLNCRHIANAHMLPKIYQTLDRLGVSKPLICTPQEFLEFDHD